MVTLRARVIVEVAIFAAKVIAVPFGVPFDESYHNDFSFSHTLTGSIGNSPPTLFGLAEGFNLAGSGAIFDIQCAKCGVEGNFNIDGRLAFSLSGITNGTISLVNQEPIAIDAIFGVSVEVQYDKSIKLPETQLFAAPTGPLTIPGIISIGPQISISTSLDIIPNAKFNLLIGGSLTIEPGVASLSLVKQSDNKLEGFQPKFTPVAKVS